MKTILLQDAVALIPDGATVMIGGFMGVGTPERLVHELVRKGKRNLTIVANDNVGAEGRGFKVLLHGLNPSAFSSPPPRSVPPRPP